MTEPLVCKVPDCGKTRAHSSPDFCVEHEYAARGDKVVAAAEHLTDYAARFESWCEQHGQPHPYH